MPGVFGGIKEKAQDVFGGAVNRGGGLFNPSRVSGGFDITQGALQGSQRIGDITSGAAGDIRALTGGLGGATEADFGALSSLRDFQMGIATGEDDPRFARFEEAQRNILGEQFRGRSAQQANFFGRSGAGGTAAELNAAQGLGREKGLAFQGLNAQLGMQQMGRQDQAAQLAGGFAGQGLGGQFTQFGQQVGGIQAASGLEVGGIESAFQMGLVPKQIQLAAAAAGVDPITGEPIEEEIDPATGQTVRGGFIKGTTGGESALLGASSFIPGLGPLGAAALVQTGSFEGESTTTNPFGFTGF